MLTSVRALPLLLLAVAAPVLAADDARALDLSLPQRPMFSAAQADGTVASRYRNDPPGTYYGDTSGVPPVDDDAAVAASACPTGPDGKPKPLTGSYTMGIGWASRGGNMHYNAADLNYCKQSYTDEGEPRTFNLDIHVGQYDGPAYIDGFHRPGGWWGGPPPRR